MKYWEAIADNLKKAGWSLGYISAADCEGRTMWIADAHRGDGKRLLRGSACTSLARAREREATRLRKRAF